MTQFTVKQLSKLAGVSVRTLHYYDEISPLRPSSVGENGYRRYGEAAALRLQQILFYKELGLSLDEIREVLDRPDFNLLHALEAHRAGLKQRARRLGRLLDTVDQTIAHLRGEQNMATKDLFAVFSEEEQAQYDQQAEALWGETARDSARRWKAYSADKKAQIMAEGSAIYADLVKQVEQAPDSVEMQANIARWHQHIRYFYEPTTAILRGLGQAYVEQPEFNANFARLDPRLAEFMRAAIEVYCARRED